MSLRRGGKLIYCRPEFTYRVFVVIVCLFLSSCGKQRNIILITLDTTRADHLGCYGYFRNTSPALDSLAANSTLFESCFAPMPTTLPTHCSILTGVYPIEHGVLTNIKGKENRFLSTKVLKTFPMMCAELGYETAAFVSAVPVRYGAGLEAGFGLYDCPEKPMRRAGETIDLAIEWLDNRDSKPYFLWVHLFDPHFPYAPPVRDAELFSDGVEVRHFMEERGIPLQAEPDSSEEREIPSTIETINLYDAEIFYMDRQLRRLFNRLNRQSRSERSALLIAGDHGEGLNQHGVPYHNQTWNEQLNVPLIMNIPNSRPQRVSNIISVVDAFPTFLGLLGDDRFNLFLQQASGRNVFENPSTIGVFGQDNGRRMDGQNYRYCLITDRWKLYYAPSPDADPGTQLFDIRSDPFELKDVLNDHREIADKMQQELTTILSEQQERSELFISEEADTSTIDSLRMEQLKALGYMGS